MSVGDIIISGIVGLSLSYVGYVLGKRSKLRELHRLQEEGYLTITYDRALTGGTSEGPTMHELLADHERPPAAQDEGFGEVRYIRRDQDGPRRDDWARSLKAQAQADQRDQEPEPEPPPKAIEE